MAEAVAQADAAPDNFLLALRAGQALVAAGRDEEARERLEAAARILPDYGGADGPHHFLAGIHERAGRGAEAEAALARHVARAPAAYEGWIRLADARRDDRDFDGAAAALEGALMAFPMFAAPHERLAEVAEELNRSDLEVRERRAALAAGAPDRAGALLALAAAERRAGDPAAARRRVLEALEIAPTWAPALSLLLELRRTR